MLAEFTSAWRADKESSSTAAAGVAGGSDGGSSPFSSPMALSFMAVTTQSSSGSGGAASASTSTAQLKRFTEGGRFVGIEYFNVTMYKLATIVHHFICAL